MRDFLSRCRNRKHKRKIPVITKPFELLFLDLDSLPVTMPYVFPARPPDSQKKSACSSRRNSSEIPDELSQKEWLREVRKKLSDHKIVRIISQEEYDPQIVFVSSYGSPLEICIGMDRNGVFHGISLAKEYSRKPQGDGTLPFEASLPELYRDGSGNWIRYFEKCITGIRCTRESAWQIAKQIEILVMKTRYSQW